MVNLINDVSMVTTLNRQQLNKVVDISSILIGHTIYEANKHGHEDESIDIGVGTLDFDINEDEITYHFKPSENLETMIKTAVLEDKDPLIDKLEKLVKIKTISRYKELM